ncbi:tRNA lysidine(34) synthetase TilS [Agilicoccus flavus]|uniref:tRNA lysidine(34) synthetase TilS n=1 Tax=Agilicoccus flavus TaxID=2775968 RepID=UPI001CF69268|nr:tRNA lysidine(34) synthetase TilS [Agilicoccus flavus]
MPGPPPAVAAVRVAVRAALRACAAGDRGEAVPAAASAVGGTSGSVVPADPSGASGAPLALVACSGGPDSLALAAGAAFEAPRAGWRAGAVVVDHGLQDGSGAVAEAAATACAALGLDPVLVEAVDVGAGGRGPEAAARSARYAALDAAARQTGARVVLLGHTLDDQAEQVLLGLARGSGARSLGGMAPRRGRYLRPLLALRRAETRAACAEAGLTPWRDPHNDDPAFTRVRARRALAALEDDLGPGLSAALARSADLLRDDADLLDDLASAARADLGPAPWPAARLAELPRAIRGRLWRRLAFEAGCPPGDVSAEHVAALDALVTRYRGQGPVALPGSARGTRRAGGVTITGPGRVEWAP